MLKATEIGDEAESGFANSPDFFDSDFFSSHAVIKRLNQLEVLPKCVVFDLDDTVWSGDVDCTAGPPFAPRIFSTKGVAVDGVYDRCARPKGPSKTSKTSRKTTPRSRPSLVLFKDVLAIIAWLESKKMDIHIAVASRTTQPRWAEEALSILKSPSGATFTELVSVSECYNCCKQTHLNTICRKLKIELSEVVFYDNLYFNLSDVEKISLRDTSGNSITAITQYTPDGLDWDNFAEGLMKFENARKFTHNRQAKKENRKKQ